MENSRLAKCPVMDLNTTEVREYGGGLLLGPLVIVYTKIVSEAWDDIVEWAPSFWESVKRGFYEGFQDGKSVVL